MIPENKDQVIKRIFLVLILGGAAAFVYFSYFFQSKYLFYLLAGLFAIGSFFFVIINSKRLFYPFIALIFILPLSSYTGFPVIIGINDIVIYAGLVIVILLSFWNNVSDNNNNGETIYLPYVFIILTAMLVLYGSIGYFKGYKITWIAREMINILYYLIPFFVIYEHKIDKFEKIIKLIVIVVFVEYILRYYFGILTLSIVRVVSRQANIVIFAFPILYLSFFSDRRIGLMARIIRIVALTATVILCIISMQRSLWLILSVNVIIGLIYYLFKKNFSLRAFFNLILILILLTFIVIIFIIILNQYFDILELLSSRFNTMGNVISDEDTALNVRYQDYKNIWRSIKSESFLGSGLGAPIFQKNTGIDKEFIDSSYLVILHKMGIPGLIAVIGLFMYMIFLSLKSFIKNTDRFESLALALILINYITISITSVAMVVYRFNLLIGIVFVIIYRYSKGQREFE